jgi:hypothetical protein
MSMVNKRQEIATALSSVEGMKGYAYRPSIPREGDAWPLLGVLERDEDAGWFMVTWNVIVFLPQDERKASEWVDVRYADLVDALTPHGYVDRIEPVGISTSANASQFGLQITMRSE